MFQQLRSLSVRMSFLLALFFGLFSMTTLTSEAHVALPPSCNSPQWITVGVNDLSLVPIKGVGVSIHLQLQEQVASGDDQLYCGRMIANAYATDPIQSGYTAINSELKAWVSPNVGDGNRGHSLSPVADCFIPTNYRSPVCPFYDQRNNVYIAGGPGHSGAVSSSICVQAHMELDTEYYGTYSLFAPNGYCIHG